MHELTVEGSEGGEGGKEGRGGEGRGGKGGGGGRGGGECHLNHFVFPQLAMLQARLETAQSAAVKW